MALKDLGVIIRDLLFKDSKPEGMPTDEWLPEPERQVRRVSEISNKLPDSQVVKSSFDVIPEFIANEFTKTRTIIPETLPNVKEWSYSTNVANSSTQRINGTLYKFAQSALKYGVVYYKKVGETNFLISDTDISGYSRLDLGYLKLNRPDDLINKHSALISKISGTSSAGAIAIRTKILADPKERNKAMENRLNVISEQMDSHGKFILGDNEESQVLNNVREPDIKAVEDLEKLIYQQYNIGPHMLDGSYNEQSYKAFHSTHLVPLLHAWADLVNILLGETNVLTYGEASAIIDLVSFATLSSLTTMVKESIYSGVVTANEARRWLGLTPYDEYGDIIYSNKNAVAINNPDINNLLATNPSGTPTDDKQQEEEEEKEANRDK